MTYVSTLKHSRLRLRTVAISVVDVVSLILAIAFAFFLRFEGASFAYIYSEYISKHLLSLAIALAAYIAVFHAFCLYRYTWRFAGIDVLWSVIQANTAGLAGLILAQVAIDGSTLPRSVLIITWITGITFMGGTRIILRVISMARCAYGKCGPEKHNGTSQERVLILGAGSDGARILKAVREDPLLNYNVVGFLDDDYHKMGTYINKVKVLGPISLLKQLVAAGVVDEAIVALPEASVKKVYDCLLDCREKKLPVKTVPRLKDALLGKTAFQLVDLSIEHLLGRPPTEVDLAAIGEYLKGKRVLVTGAGGSIGSELCRQIILNNPESLVLLGHGENSIHQICQELQWAHPNMAGRIHTVIASVARQPRLDQVFEQYRPEIVFHAAAHKHVPLMESNESEAVLNNVFGTKYVADACGRYGAERIVLISTDKAAEPNSIMGATKWLCEEIVRTSTASWPDTSYIAVRFGNVLGSRGSVVPIFREQIKHGGPVTVTHPDMTRYFMTIPEAVKLVLQAGAVGNSGDLYLLDMGDPVRITDLACDMIKLYGFKPDVDMKVEFTGIRPGEKLHEKLTSCREQIDTTVWEGLFLVRRMHQNTLEQISAALDHLEYAANNGINLEVRQVLSELVPSEYGSRTKVD